MKIYYNGKVIAKKDQRFKDDFWTDGKKDPRIRKRKKIRKINLSSMAKRFIALILVLGFVGLHTAGFNQNGTTTPAEAENASDGIVEPPEWIKEKYPDNQINEFDGGETGDLFDKYFGSEANIARAIAQAESGMNAGAVSKLNWNGTRDWGVMQINSCHADKVGGNLELLKDLETNIRVAKEIRDSWSGWTAWTVYNSGEYKKYL
jgi:soluble lytic murein transglycosylase-like protein